MGDNVGWGGHGSIDSNGSVMLGQLMGSLVSIPWVAAAFLPPSILKGKTNPPKT